MPSEAEPPPVTEEIVPNWSNNPILRQEFEPTDNLTRKEAYERDLMTLAQLLPTAILSAEMKCWMALLLRIKEAEFTGQPVSEEDCAALDMAKKAMYAPPPIPANVLCRSPVKPGRARKRPAEEEEAASERRTRRRTRSFPSPPSPVRNQPIPASKYIDEVINLPQQAKRTRVPVPAVNIVAAETYQKGMRQPVRGTPIVVKRVLDYKAAPQPQPSTSQQIPIETRNPSNGGTTVLRCGNRTNRSRIGTKTKKNSGSQKSGNSPRGYPANNN